MADFDKTKFKNKSELADYLGIKSRSTLYARAKKYSINIDKKVFNQDELHVLNGEQQNIHTDNIEIAIYEKEIELKNEFIEELKKDKADLKKALDQQQQLSLKDKQQLSELQDKLTLLESPTNDEIEISEDTTQDLKPKKKSFWNFFK